MKNRMYIITMLIIGMLDIATTGTVKAKVGCMDDSKYLAEKFDTKELHYVECNCPCKVIVQPHNQCLFCQHYHAGPSWEIIQPRPNQIKENYDAPKMVLNPANRNVKTILEKLATTAQFQGS